MHYQPQIELSTNRIIGLEALVRWDIHSKNPLSAIEGLAIIRDNKQVLEFDCYIVKEVFSEVKHIIKTNEDILVAINLHISTIESTEFIGFLKEVLEDSALNSKNFKLEIIEREAIDRFDMFTNHIAVLKQMGFMVSLDDFGIDNNCLYMLALVNPHEIKIDKFFIQAIHEQTNAVIVDHIIQIAHQLDIKVVAEGIEESHTKDMLEKLGCDYGQGFLFHKPMLIKDAQKLFKSTNN